MFIYLRDIDVNPDLPVFVYLLIYIFMVEMVADSCNCTTTTVFYHNISVIAKGRKVLQLPC